MFAARAGGRRAAPSTLVPIHRGHPLGRQVIAVWTPAGGLTPRDPGWGFILAPNAATVTLANSRGARAWNLASSTDALRGAFRSPGFPISLGLVFRPAALSTNANLFNISNSAVVATRSRLGLRVGASSTIEAYSMNSAGAAVAAASSNTLTAGALHVAVAVFPNTSERYVVLDKVKSGLSSGTNVPLALDTFNIGQGAGSTLQAGQPGDFLMAVLWGTAVSDPLARQFCHEPFALLAPSRRRWIAPFSPTAGNAPGATLRTAARFVSGGATGVRNATTPGATLRTAARFAGGGASAAQEGNAPGASLRAAARFVSGGASAGQQGDAPGALLRAAARFVSGGATGARNASAPGAALRAVARFTGGDAAGVRNATAAGATLRAVARFAGGGAFAPGAGGDARRRKWVIGPSGTF